MTHPLFDPDKCAVPEVPSVDFQFVSDCSIAPPPPPIFDCPVPPVPQEPCFPCPEFNDINVTLNTGYENCPAVTPAGGTMAVTKVDTEPCRFAIDLDLNIPLPVPPCPNITAGNVAVVVDYADVIVGENAFTVTKETVPGNCNNNEPDNCKFTIDLDLKIPIPRPPEITGPTGPAGPPGGPTGATGPTGSTGPGYGYLLEVGSVSASWLDCSTDNPTATVTITPPVDGKQKFNLKIQIPNCACPCFYCNDNCTNFIEYTIAVPGGPTVSGSFPVNQMWESVSYFDPADPTYYTYIQASILVTCDDTDWCDTHWKLSMFLCYKNGENNPDYFATWTARIVSDPCGCPKLGPFALNTSGPTGSATLTFSVT